MQNNTIAYIITLFFAAACFFWAGCSKSHTLPPAYPVASLNVINALPASAPLMLIQGSITGTIGQFSGIGALSYASTAELIAKGGTETFYAVQKNGDTASIDPQGGGIFMFDSSLNFTAGGLYSLFITGTDTSNPDHLFVQDTVTQRTDSTVGIRFVNLSAGSNSVSVDIKGQANGGVVPALAFKGITGFMSFPTNSTISNYVFEFRDVVSGNLLASYTLNGVNNNSSTVANKVLYSNLTIALIGQPTGGKVAQTCMLVTNSVR